MALFYKTTLYGIKYLAENLQNISPDAHEQRRIAKERNQDRAHMNSREKEAVVIDWSCVTNGDRCDPMYHPQLCFRRKEKDGETESDVETHGGERTIELQ